MVFLHPFLLLLVAVGSLGLALVGSMVVDNPWLCTVVCCAPVVVLYGGSEIVGEATTPRWWRRGIWLELVGASLYLAGLIGALLALLLGVRFALAGTLIALPGGVVTSWLLRRRLRLLRGRPLPTPDPWTERQHLAEAGPSALVWTGPPAQDRGEVGGLHGALSIVGLTSIGLTLGGGALCAAGLLGLLSGRGDLTQMLTASLMFGACSILGVHQGLARWSAFVPGSSRPLFTISRALLWLAVPMMLSALVLFALRWPGLRSWVRWALAGGIGLVAVMVAARQVQESLARRSLGGRPASVGPSGLDLPYRRVRVHIPWSEVQAAVLVEIQGNLGVGLLLGSRIGPAHLRGSGDLERTWRRLEQASEWSREIHGVDWVIFESQLGCSAGDWLREVEALLDDAVRRAATDELGPPRRQGAVPPRSRDRG